MWCGELDTFQKNNYIEMLFSDNFVKLSLGDLSDMGTPGPIPNPEVKHISADGTWRATSRESRSLPRGFSISSHLWDGKSPSREAGGFFYCASSSLSILY